MSVKLVKRFQTPSGPLRPLPYKVMQDWSKVNESSVGERFNRDRVLPAIQLVRSITKPIEDQFIKAKKRNTNTANIQLALWNKGFFKGLKDRRGRDVTYNTAVDGLSGRMTNAAIEAAKAAGYDIDLKHGLVTLRVEKPQPTQTVEQKASNQTSVQLSLPINEGHAIYLHYPNFVGRAKNALKIGDLDVGDAVGDPDLPVGHAAVVLVDKNGNSSYYEYGRYKPSDGHILGLARPTVKGGNWRHILLPRVKQGENDSTYMARILGMLPDTKTGAYQAMTIPSVDIGKATQYILSQANNKNRKEYGITNTCATGATNAVLPFRINKLKNKDNRENTEGYSSAAKTWSILPYSTGRYAAKAREAASDIFIMNQ